MMNLDANIGIIAIITNNFDSNDKVNNNLDYDDNDGNNDSDDDDDDRIATISARPSSLAERLTRRQCRPLSAFHLVFAKQRIHHYWVTVMMMITTSMIMMTIMMTAAVLWSAFHLVPCFT